ncbi:alpha-(1,3)-fucosyltransferase C-like, partial [Amphibalanus amphitrite]|uniref:alpha-(1,3)-fucosyltransferase C-like n=1 Tax=Amphibalanus amphitrite TaxID=1232801 RepID=UPI001C8FC496
RNKTILLWTTFYGSPDPWELLFYDTVSGGCPVSGCTLTHDREQLDSADAVLFHLLDVQLEDLPRRRPAGQLWVLFCLESPGYPLVRRRRLARLNGLFNWTMTYRWDSDVAVPYGLVLPPGRLPRAVSAVLPRQPAFARYPPPTVKRRLVAWMVSNCRTPGKRERYVAQLRRHIQVDIYGSCGTLKCGRSESVQQQRNHTNFPCEQAITDYKFYLAFENTLCPDYVTEKFFRTLALGTVPVVFGGAQYSSLAPEGSYIDALQYEPRELAELLLYLDRNDTAYRELLRWQADHRVVNAHPLRPLTCGLCRRLHELPAGAEVGVRYDLHRWYSANQCHQWRPRG